MTAPRLVVFDENPQQAAFWNNVFQDLGAAGAGFQDPFEGLLTCITKSPHAIILGPSVGRMGLPELLRRLRSISQTQALPILAVADITPAQMVELRALGIAPAVTMAPSDAAQVSTSLRTLLAQPKGAHSQTPAEAEFAGHRLRQLVGAGTHSNVYEAVHPKHRTVALKVTPKSPRFSASAIARYFEQTSALVGVEHHNLVKIHDIGETDHSVYWTSDFVDGKSLVKLLDAACLSMADRKSLVSQAFDAVMALHFNRILHRTLRPSSFIRRVDGVLVLTDYGTLEDTELVRTAKSRHGTGAEFFGATSLLAPEVLDGGDHTPLSDQYSLGRTVQCIIENSRPTTPYQPLSVTFPTLPSILSDVLMKMTHPDPASRFPSLGAAKTAVVMSWPTDGDSELSIFT